MGYQCAMAGPTNRMLHCSFWLLFLELLAVTSEQLNEDMPTWPDKLKRDLLLDYNKLTRPAQHYNTTVVDHGLTINYLELDEIKSTITVYCWVSMVWVDEKLRWNKTNYGNLEVLHFGSHEIWQPDIDLFNSATGNPVNLYGNVHIVANADGKLLWVPPAELTAFCDLDLRMWPFDSQVCHLKFVSWTYREEQVDLNLFTSTPEINLDVKNKEWQLMKLTAYANVTQVPSYPEPYPELIYSLTLKRRSPAYSAIVFTPATVIVLMTLAIFWLPPTAGEKLILSGCTAIIICLFLLFFSQKLPAIAGNTPLVVLFFSSSLYLVCLSMIVSVAVINTARFQHSATVPWIVRSSLTGWVGRALGLGPIIGQACSLHRRKVPGSSQQDQPQLVDEIHDEEHQMFAYAANRQDWILIAAAIDRMTFLVYCIVYAILGVAYSV